MHTHAHAQNTLPHGSASTRSLPVTSPGSVIFPERYIFRVSSALFVLGRSARGRLTVPFFAVLVQAERIDVTMLTLRELN